MHWSRGYLKKLRDGMDADNHNLLFYSVKNL